MTEMVVVQKKASSTSGTRLYLKHCFNIASSAEFIGRSEMNTDTLRNTYRYNPFTKSIVEIDPSQAWFWTPEWLKGELEVEEEKKGENFQEFYNIEDIFDM